MGIKVAVKLQQTRLIAIYRYGALHRIVACRKFDKTVLLQKKINSGKT
jgi:hypothetical protein